ncbi:MAG: hypothetical protein U0Z44_12220 [Kouleothrix sp.]
MLRLTLEHGTSLRRATRIRPELAVLDDAIQSGAAAGSYTLALGEIAADARLLLLLELLAAPQLARPGWGRAEAGARGMAPLAADLAAQRGVEAAPPAVLDAAAREQMPPAYSSAPAPPPHAATRPKRRACYAPLPRASTRWASLRLAQLARSQASTLDQTGQADTLAAKELTYATRRLGEG